MTLHIIGNPVSPYVRKVMSAMILKGLDFDFDPITPFLGNDEFERLSPLRRIPVLVDGDLVINDSTVIAEYLDDKWPDVAVYPKSPADRARARWIEEYCDGRIGEVIVWGLFYQRVIGPRIFKDPTDEVRVAKALDDDLPAIMDWLEGQAPESGFLFGDQPMVADFAVQMCFTNAELAAWVPDAERWPKAAGLIARVADLEVSRTLRSWVNIIITTRLAEQRTALAEAGAPIWQVSHAADAPRRGVMAI